MPARSFVAGIGVLLHCRFHLCLYLNYGILCFNFLFRYNFFFDCRLFIHHNVFLLRCFNRSGIATSKQKRSENCKYVLHRSKWGKN